MGAFLRQHYGDCEGPLGIPCQDRQARALEAVLQALPMDELHAPGHLVVTGATTELLPGERADVSWISTEDPDRMHEIVLAAGMNDEHFKLNPVVTLQHAYGLPPVGRSPWRRRVRDGGRAGVKAKTVYPPRPAAWTAGEPWPPDFAFPLVQSGLLCGKSIGFLPTKVRTPTDDEIRQRPGLRDVRRIIEEWVLLEYACVYFPAQPAAVVEAVTKGMALPASIREVLNLPESPPLPFTTLAEVERHLTRRIEAMDVPAVAGQALDRARGRV
jgi:hypothetical protein